MKNGNKRRKRKKSVRRIGENEEKQERKNKTIRERSKNMKEKERKEIVEVRIGGKSGKIKQEEK